MENTIDMFWTAHRSLLYLRTKTVQIQPVLKERRLYEQQTSQGSVYRFNTLPFAIIYPNSGICTAES